MPNIFKFAKNTIILGTYQLENKKDGL